MYSNTCKIFLPDKILLDKTYNLENINSVNRKIYRNSTMCYAKNCISRNAILAETIENFESCRATSRCPPHLSLSLYPEYVRYHMYAEPYTSRSTPLQI